METPDLSLSRASLFSRSPHPPPVAPPYTTVLPEQVRLRAGDALRLQCLAHGTPPLRFQWSRAGRAALAAGAETTADGTLLIARVKLTDSGTYKCRATNHLGASEALGKVVVKSEWRVGGGDRQAVVWF